MQGQLNIREFVPVIMAPERPAEGVTYLHNSEGRESLAQKIAMLKDYDFDYAVFHHDDLKIETPELVGPSCERMRMDNVGVAGVIGTLCLAESCTWWNPLRGVVTVGAILQGDGKGGAYPMLDGPGYRADAISVDGCFLVLSRDFIDRYEPHDFGSWRYLYDVDACLQCLQMGKNVGIVDIRCRHDSQGQMTPDFEQCRRKFLEYWKPRVGFPVIKQSKFKE